MGMIPVPSQEYIYNYTLLHPNSTAWGVVFEESFTPVRTVSYQIWYNASLVANEMDVFGTSLISFLRGMDEAIITVLNDPNAKVFAKMDVSIKDWPLVPAKTLSDTIVLRLGPVFFFCSIMVIFVNALNQVVTEKEAGLRHAMELTGLLVGFLGSSCVAELLAASYTFK